MDALCVHFFPCQKDDVFSQENPHYKRHPHFQTQNVTLVSFIRRVL